MLNFFNIFTIRYKFLYNYFGNHISNIIHGIFFLFLSFFIPTLYHFWNVSTSILEKKNFFFSLNFNTWSYEVNKHIFFFFLIMTICVLFYSNFFFWTKKFMDILLTCSIINWILSLYIYIIYTAEKSGFLLQCNLDFNFLGSKNILKEFPLIFQADGISLILILLTTFFTPLLLLLIWNEEYKKKILGNCVVLTNTIIIFIFSSFSLFTFFVFYEMLIIPMFFIIAIWGPTYKKMKAGYYFLIYSLLSSVGLVFALALIHFELRTTHYGNFLKDTLFIPKEKQFLIWCGLFFAFAVKIPMFGVHLWLPEAHVEAPTVGSVILASLLLKTGGYGLIRFLLPLFPGLNQYLLPFIYSFALLGIIYASMKAIIELDMKRIIAYSSIVHMNAAVIGIFTYNSYGLSGAILMMVSHGLVSGGLFILIGFLYDRYHSKLLLYYGGISTPMPIFSYFFMFFLFANIGFPGTLNFISELLVYISIFEKSKIIAIIVIFMSVLGTIYSIWLLNRVCFGTLNLRYIDHYIDLRKKEIFILIPLIFLTILFGLFPNFIINEIYYSSYKVLYSIWASSQIA